MKQNKKRIQVSVPKSILLTVCLNTTFVFNTTGFSKKSGGQLMATDPENII